LNLLLIREGTRIVTHSRSVPNSVRQPTALSQARKRAREAKKQKKIEDLKRLKELRREEVERRRKMVREVGGKGMDGDCTSHLKGLSFADALSIDSTLGQLDLDGDFDPDDHDQKMQAIYGEEFYGLKVRFYLLI
jgi:protein KRI1